MGYHRPMLLLFACAAPPATVDLPAEAPTEAPAPRDTGTAPDPDAPVEAVPGVGADTGTGEPVEAVGQADDPVFSDTAILHIDIELSDEAVAALTTSPSAYVVGSVSANGHTWGSVGVRLKGSASWQPISQKPNWKLKFVDYSDERFYGLDRLTLNNNVWDASMMAQDLAYWFFAAAGVPAPRTGYAWVTLNGEDKGLYTILESMDRQFVEAHFEHTEGNLYEMTRECDFDTDGSCYELQTAGDDDDEHALDSATSAARSGQADRLREAFQWQHLIRFFAVERVINHPDSYSYNLNNYFVYHDPTLDLVSLIPWGADSTFVYTYPPEVDDYPCEASAYWDVMTSSPYGHLGSLCESDLNCANDLETSLREVAALLETSGLAERAEANRARIRDYMQADPWLRYDVDDFDRRVDCFITWMGERPEEIEGWLAR